MQAYAKVCCRRSFERGNEQTTICASAIWNLWLCQTVLVSFASIRAQYNAVILQPWGGNCHGISDALNQIWDDFLKCESFDPQEIVFNPRAISVWLLTWPYAVWLLRIAAVIWPRKVIRRKSNQYLWIKRSCTFSSTFWFRIAEKLDAAWQRQKALLVEEVLKRNDPIVCLFQTRNCLL